MKDFLGEDVQNFVVHAWKIAEKTAKSIELPGSDSSLKFPASEDDVLQLGVVLDPFTVAVGERVGVDERRFLFVDE